MSLTKSDLQSIRTVLQEEVRPIIPEEVRPILREEVRPIIREAVQPVVREEVKNQMGIQLAPIRRQLNDIDGRLEALKNDVKEIYFILSRRGKTKTA